MDSLDTLRIVLRVAELGGFARAADSLALSKAAVSIAVQRLEASLGTQLFHRTTRRVQLTADGQAFYERARDLLDDMDELHGMFQRDGGALKGRLRVDMPAGMASRFVIPRLPEFLDRYPELSIEISGTDRRVDVVREGFDCVVRVGTLDDSSLVARPLGAIRLINCASPDYLRRYGTPRSIEDLRDHRLVHYAGTLGQRPLGFEYPDGGGHAALPMAGSVTVNNGAAYEAAAMAGLGIIQVPAMAMQSRLAAGELVEVLPDCPPPPMPVTLLYAQRRNLPRRVRVFMDWIAQVLEPHLEPVPSSPRSALPA
ncbi:LysR family transcriptional regulator [Cupriavidus gilardii]|uniref:LysR family transcriptional regulator n=1 Tax=Cupriavidus gilardii TaxID=82541 RepID=A0A849BB61_9BURK|nr:LysR family transcriptional regulator [Cupriavidus gilardii]ALD93527.1 LysR family transcriptional regulator [Cupriavidus gilardii CR3]KAB0595559.1 LysR family transcriptional regulator [Cupriavidus gilardii]MCT9013443.1 LysR family transcriptional regulator [Cupriavidus gilardii]MCT9016474.1 LysR family transcriptional regulator [Cupriavidus gilardii]MCT9056244.1 LysR family transcriptional regulator [Cupriavidus gilardii]